MGLDRWGPGYAERANRLDTWSEQFRKDESRDGNGRLNPRLCRGLRDRDVPDVANLAVLLVAWVRVSVGNRVRAQCAHCKNERDCKQTQG